MEWKKIVKFTLIGLTASLVLFFSVFKIDDPDTMQYLASGQQIIHHGFSHDCIFSYASQTCQIVYNEWLFHIITYGIHSLSGYNGLVLFQMLIILAIYGLIFWYQKKEKNSIASTVFFMTIATIIAAERFIFRADLLVLLIMTGMYICLRLVLNDLDKKKYWFATILGLQLLWTNIHGSFPLGWAIIGAFFTAQFLPILWKHKSEELQKVKFLFVLLVASVLISLINPYGLKAFTLPFHFYFGPAEFHSQVEFVSPFAPADFEHASVTAFRYLIILFGLGIILARKKIKLADIFILFGFLYLAWHSRRYMALFAIFSALILPSYFDYIYSSAKEWLISRKKWFPKINFALGVIAFFIFAVYVINTDQALASNRYYTADQRWRRSGFGLSEIVYPIGAANFVADNNLSGNMFNDYGSGTYLNWRLFPQHKTFIDGHTYTLELLQEYKSAVVGEISVNDLVKKYNINYFLLDYVNGDSIVLIKNLYNDPNWSLVYFDENSVIFVANTKDNSDLINKNKIDFEKNTNFNPDTLPTFKQHINLSYGFSNRAGLLATVGLTEKARDQYKKAVGLDKTNYIAQLNLGKMNYKLGDKDAALKSYQDALSEEYYFAPTHFNLGVYDFNEHKLDLAIVEFQAALDINKNYPLAHYNLGLIYESQGDKQRAIEEYNNELKVNPNQIDALNKLKN